MVVAFGSRQQQRSLFWAVFTSFTFALLEYTSIVTRQVYIIEKLFISKARDLDLLTCHFHFATVEVYQALAKIYIPRKVI